MARPLRIEYPNAVYHVTSRGNEQRFIFNDGEDKEFFLKTLERVNNQYHWICHAYCLMDNHYHLIIETPDGNLSYGMRQLNGIYTQVINKRHCRKGHLFQGRYKAILIQKDSHLLEVSRYVVLNPVRAGIVTNPEDWPESSYHATAGYEKPHPCLTTEWLLSQFNARQNIAVEQYRRFVIEGMGNEPIWNRVKGQSIFGKDSFMDEQIIRYIKNCKDIREIPKSQRLLDRPSLPSLFSQEIKHDRKRRNRVLEEAVYQYGYKQSEVAEYLGLHYSTVSRLLNNNTKHQK